MSFSVPGALKKLRTTAATSAAKLATTASRATGRGAGGMIGGLIANAIDPSIMTNLGGGRPAVLVTGTNGKSTTTRMLAAAVRAEHHVATNDGGDNMDAGIISALMAGKDASHLVLEVDELHVPHVADNLNPQALVLLNLTRDQLDRVGEINKIERALRGAVEAHPDMLVIANCDDVLMTSVAYDAKNVIWVSAGAGWLGDSVTCPRTGGHVVRTEDDWYAVKPLADGREFRRPQPTWGIDKHGVITPTAKRPLNLALPGRANRGNAAQAIAAAVEGFGVDLIALLPRRKASMTSPAGIPPSTGRAARFACCWPRTPPAGKRPCPWWTAAPMGWSSPRTGRLPMASTCPGSGT